MAESGDQSKKEEPDNSGCIATSAQRTEYFAKLERWLLEAYAWQTFTATVPYVLASSQILHGEY